MSKLKLFVIGKAFNYMITKSRTRAHKRITM